MYRSQGETVKQRQQCSEGDPQELQRLAENFLPATNKIGTLALVTDIEWLINGCLNTQSIPMLKSDGARVHLTCSQEAGLFWSLRKGQSGDQYSLPESHGVARDPRIPRNELNIFLRSISAATFPVETHVRASAACEGPGCEQLSIYKAWTLSVQGSANSKWWGAICTKAPAMHVTVSISKPAFHPLCTLACKDSHTK